MLQTTKRSVKKTESGGYGLAFRDASIVHYAEPRIVISDRSVFWDFFVDEKWAPHTHACTVLQVTNENAIETSINLGAAVPYSQQQDSFSENKCKWEEFVENGTK